MKLYKGSVTNRTKQEHTAAHISVFFSLGMKNKLILQAQTTNLQV